MLRNDNIRCIKISHKFDAKLLRKEFIGIANQLEEKDHHQNHDGKLREGATAYHTGGWGQIMLTEYSTGSCKLIPQIKQWPYFKEVIDWFQSPLTRVKTSVLKAGHKILPHIGNQKSHEYARFHIPVITNDKCLMFVEGSQYHLDAGSLWYLNQARTHWVENTSEEDRVHLMIDVQINKWTLNLVHSSTLWKLF